MSGLFGAVLSGGLQGYAKGTIDNNNAANDRGMMQLKTEVDMMMQDRIRENARQTNINDAKSIEGLINAKNAKAEQLAKDVGGTTPAADFVRHEMMPSPAQLADDKSAAASSIGRQDIARDYEAQGTGLRNDLKEQNRHDESNKKTDQASQQAQKNFELQMKKIDAANALAEKHAEKGDNQSARAALSSVLGDIGKQQDRIEGLMASALDEPQKAVYAKQLATLDAERQSARMQLNKLAGVVPEIKPASGIDDLFPTKAKPTGQPTATVASPAAATQNPVTPSISPEKQAVYERALQNSGWVIKGNKASKGGMTYSIEEAMLIEKRNNG